MLVDLHTHSNHSDGLPSVQTIEEHCLRRGCGLALTDHNEVRGSIQLAEREQVTVLPGIEVGTEEGLEFLVYFDRPASLEQFYREAVEPYLRPRFMVRSRVRSVACLRVAKGLGGFISLAHPFAFGRKSLDHHRHKDGAYRAFVLEVLQLIDAVEQYNGGIPARCNRRSASLPDALGKRATVGSDAHTVAAIGSAGVEFEMVTTRDRSADLFAALGRHGSTTQRRGDRLLITLPVIAYKHTQFFALKGNAPARDATTARWLWGGASDGK